MASFDSIVSTSSASSALNLDGYNFAIDKMHFIASKYPLKSEMYLRNTHVPDLQEYLAWKDVSTIALVNKLTAKQALYAFEEKLRAGGMYATQADGVISPTRSEASTVIAADPQELEAARILGAMQFKAMTSHGTLHGDHLGHRPHQPDPAVSMSSPIFPRPDELPMPSGEDAFLLNPVLEDAQRRWVQGVHKQDFVREVFHVDEEGERTRVRKTYYVVDGEEFLDVETPRKRKAVQQRARRQVNNAIAKTSMISTIPNSQSQLRKRPLDSAIALDEQFESPSCKRQRSVSSDDVPLSSMSQPGGGGFLGRSSSPFRDPEFGAANGANMHPGLVANSRLFSMRGFIFNGQAILPAPTTMSSPMHHHSHIMATPLSGTSRSSRRRGPPAPLNLSATTHSKRARTELSKSPSPVKTNRKPQHSSTTPGKTAQPAPLLSSAATTPRRNKYVPTTPNPQRWSPAELYHLNALARKGLHPKELHPLMQQQFPDKIRSVHAIKDRRDKMSRAKELIGKVPDYQIRYGEI